MTPERRWRNAQDRDALRDTRIVLGVDRVPLDAPDSPFLVTPSPIPGHVRVYPRRPAPARLRVLLAQCSDAGGYFWSVDLHPSENYVDCIAWPSREQLTPMGQP